MACGGASLKRSANNVKKDVKKLEIKKIRQDRRAAKNQRKAANYMAKGRFKTSAKYFKKASKHQRRSQKRAKTIWHNKKLLDLYTKRIRELDPEVSKTGKDYVDNLLTNYGDRKTFGY